MKQLGRYQLPLIIFCFFETTALILWRLSGQIFFLFNFSYIGFFVSLGIGLMLTGKQRGRLFIQLAVGLYLLLYLGIWNRENIALEGFWYYLLTGVFEAAVIHYLIAKVFGPLLFGRGWCGYACWSAMIFDLLPYRQAQRERRQSLGIVRYLLFFLAIGFAAAMVYIAPTGIDRILFLTFLIGNLVFYVAGIALSILLKDNRAFCKYICPTSVMLKATSYFALMRVKCEETLCTNCGLCKAVCPMDVDIPDNRRRRKHGTECIQCMQCKTACPHKALS